MNMSSSDSKTENQHPPQMMLTGNNNSTTVSNSGSAIQLALQSFQAAAEAAGMNPQNPNIVSASAAPQNIAQAQQLFGALKNCNANANSVLLPNDPQSQQLWQQAWLAVAPPLATAIPQSQLVGNGSSNNSNSAQKQQQQQQQQITPAFLAAQPNAQQQQQMAMFLNAPPGLQQQQNQPSLVAATQAQSSQLVSNSGCLANGIGGPSVVSASSCSQPAASGNNGSKSSKTNSNNSVTMDDEDRPPMPTKSESELAKMSGAERRRYERNLREQQRSYKISQQIKTLRDVLQESNIPFRPNKYSILVSVAEYIQQLQSRAIMLDSEHQRLIDTIRDTNELVTSGGTIGEDNSLCFGNGNAAVIDDNFLMVQGIDYQSVFQFCPYPLGIATLDGRMLACNRQFEELLNAEQNTMKDQSFFVYIRNHQQIFEAMAALLKQSSTDMAAYLETSSEVRQQQLLYWCGHIVTPRNEKFPFTITLTNSVDNNPKFFSLSASTAPTMS